MKPLMLVFAFALLTPNLLAAGPERAWQTGTWFGFDVVRPKIVFGTNRAPQVGTSAPAITEVRTYVIETDTLRLELKENTTADANRLDVTIGGPVTFALEKNTVYIKVEGGHEHRLSVTKNIKKNKPRVAGDPYGGRSA
jgi:hypothetical protein